MSKKLISLFSLAVFCFSTTLIAADWKVVSDESRVAFASVKAETVGEVHHFTVVEGGVDNAGKVTISLPIAGIETAIDIRNERMREFLFEVVKFPTVKLTATIDMASYGAMAVGSRKRVSVPASIDLHGVMSEVDLDVFVTRLSENRVAVDTASPVLVDAEEFELGDGLDKLKELAGLDTIGLIVPVTFSLIFSR